MDDGQRLKRFTVSEAAEILHISKDAVRKRMQRGTLRYDKTLDGQVYVYLDAPKNQGGDRKAAATDPNEGRSWDFAQLSALAGLVGAIATMIYVSGLFALWAPIARFYTHDFAASWNAVSIIPRTVVIGHGFTRIWIPTIAFGLLLAVLELGFRIQTRVWKTIGVMIGIISLAGFGTAIISMVLDKVGVISLRDLVANWPGTNPPDVPEASTQGIPPLVYLESFS